MGLADPPKAKMLKCEQLRVSIQTLSSSHPHLFLVPNKCRAFAKFFLSATEVVPQESERGVLELVLLKPLPAAGKDLFTPSFAADGFK